MGQKRVSESIMPTLKGMAQGETASFSLDKALSVRSTCAMLSLQNGMKFKTRTDRENRIITVERV